MSKQKDKDYVDDFSDKFLNVVVISNSTINSIVTKTSLLSEMTYIFRTVT